MLRYAQFVCPNCEGEDFGILASFPPAAPGVGIMVVCRCGFYVPLSELAGLYAKEVLKPDPELPPAQEAA